MCGKISRNSFVEIISFSVDNGRQLSKDFYILILILDGDKSFWSPSINNLSHIEQQYLFDTM